MTKLTREQLLEKYPQDWIPKNPAYLLRTCNADYTSYGGFVWPREVGAVVVPESWNSERECGNGIHGLLNGTGYAERLDWGDTAIWMVVIAEESEVVDLIGKVKAPAVRIMHIGNQQAATEYIRDNAPTQGQGCHGIMLSGGHKSIISGGYSSTVRGGDYSTVSGGYSSTVRGGDYSTVSGGYSSTVSGGDYSTVRGGDYSTVSGGSGAVLQLSWWDGEHSRCRIETAYVGEDGIKSDVAYKLDENHKFVEADNG